MWSLFRNLSFGKFDYRIINNLLMFDYRIINV